MFNDLWFLIQDNIIIIVGFVLIAFCIISNIVFLIIDNCERNKNEYKENVKYEKWKEIQLDIEYQLKENELKNKYEIYKNKLINLENKKNKLENEYINTLNELESGAYYD